MDFSQLSSSLLYGLLALLYSNRVTGTGYIENVLEHDSVCWHASNLNIITLEDESALVIRNGPSIQRWAGQREFNCRFILTSPFGFGVFAVMQHMSFRRNAQGNCIDYIQFRHTEKTMSIGDFNIKLRSSEPWGAKICGNMNALRVDGYRDDYESNNSVAGDDELLQNSFVDHRGLIEFRIYLRNKTLDDDEELNFEIVFTPFRECDRTDGIWKSCGSRTCIYEGFFHDGKLNCPYGGCKDEIGCCSATALSVDDRGLFGRSAVGVKIVAGLSIFLTVYVAFTRLFGCYAMLLPQVRDRPMEMQRIPRPEAATASPDLAATTRSSDEDHTDELPPLYDSLFPS